MTIVLLILGLLMFIGLVIVHEYGHFLAARRHGIDVPEFGLGFPPRAKVLTRKNGTTYTLNWLPFGGFVRLKGEHDADTEPHSFGAAPLRAKVLVMVAGVGMNLLVAFVILTFLGMAGMPKILDNQFSIKADATVIRDDVLIGALEDGSPAQQAGLQQRDRLVNIGPLSQRPVAITSQDQLVQATKRFAGQTVAVTVKRGDQNITKVVTLRSGHEGETKGYLGVGPTEYVLTRTTWSSPIVAIGTMGQVTVATFQGLFGALSNLVRGHVAQAGSQVTGPVGVFFIIKNGSLLGYQFILMIIAIISLTLAIMNLLPIPALDGGRLYLILLYRGLRRPLTIEKEDLINGAGFMALMLLFVIITVLDVKRN